MECVEWEIELHPSVDRWFSDLCELDSESADLVERAIDVLAEVGPTLGRLLADRVHGSRYHNMKELRPPSAGEAEFRILFAFDPERRAILLVAGDKSGSWKSRYERQIPIADKRYAEHIAHLEDG